ncbi:cytochrome-c peroxidase [Wenyingzhuangia sp. IMCC45533]
MDINKSVQFFIICIGLVSCRKEKNKEKTISPEVNFDAVQQFYTQSIKNSITYIDSLAMYESHSDKAKNLFKKIRVEFKKAEPYVSYLNPEVGHRVNGPALPNFTDDTHRVLAPIGLQKIEESIYDGGVSKKVYLEEIRLTRGLLHVLQKNIDKRKINSQRFFISIHQQLLRIVSFGITGFDTPVSHLGIQETGVSLQGLKFVYENSIQEIVETKNKDLNKELITNIDKAIRFTEDNNDFDTFDRYTFIKNYINPITRNWLAVRKLTAIWEPVNTTPFNFEAPTFFENNSFNVNYFTQPSDRNPSSEKIALGKKLFFEKKLSSNQSVSCASCHNPTKAYTDGFKTSKDNRGNNSLRNAPTLINVAFQKSFFLDGRSKTLNDQIGLVFKNKNEFDTEVHQFSNRILTDTTYTKMFVDAYGKIPTKNTEVIKSISAYISTLNGFNAKFDKNIRGDENTYSASEKRGMNLFMGKALCATCHFMPLTNGTVPPFFTESEREVIGVSKTAKNKELDTDDGYYWLYKKDIHKGMFKTPTLRNIALTAPYMHNGVYNTLEEVMNFYNKGGGAGLGFKVLHQTLPFDELNLSEQEIKDLIAFMKTLTDISFEEKQEY